jgi:hypothetical protein
VRRQAAVSLGVVLAVCCALGVHMDAGRAASVHAGAAKKVCKKVPVTNLNTHKTVKKKVCHNVKPKPTPTPAPTPNPDYHVMLPLNGVFTFTNTATNAVVTHLFQVAGYVCGDPLTGTWTLNEQIDGQAMTEHINFATAAEASDAVPGFVFLANGFDYGNPVTSHIAVTLNDAKVAPGAANPIRLEMGFAQTPDMSIATVHVVVTILAGTLPVPSPSLCG